MTNQSDWHEDIFAEKGLSQVYRASRVIKPSRTNRRIMLMAYLATGIYVIANLCFLTQNSFIVSAIERSALSLLTISTAILGFLVTGFSIFVSGTKPETFKKLIKTRFDNTGISYFKHIIFNFLNVFTVYMFALLISFSVVVVSPLGLPPVLNGIVHVPNWLIVAFNSIVLGLLFCYTLYSILRLKSFIWQIYQSLLINLSID